MLRFTLVGILILGGCAPGITRVGAPPPMLQPLGAKTFVLGSGASDYVEVEADVRTAIEKALSDRGYVANDRATYRVDFAFSAQPRGVSIGEGENEQRISFFCKPKRYSLTMAFVARSSGDLVSRRTASAVRCGRPPANFLNQLAEAIFEPD